jgi:hypothetical protein
MMTENIETRTRRYRGISYTRPIDEAKRRVPVIELADRLCGLGGLRRIGKEWVGSCALPDQEDRSPSFTANSEKNVWFCHGCLRGGDVVELARLAGRYDEREAHLAAAYLLMEFGQEVPQRLPSWRRRQYRQNKIRDAIDRERIEHIRLLVFRLVWVPWLKRLPAWSREEATQSAWERERSIALRLYEQRRAA